MSSTLAGQHAEALVEVDGQHRGRVLRVSRWSPWCGIRGRRAHRCGPWRVPRSPRRTPNARGPRQQPMRPRRSGSSSSACRPRQRLGVSARHDVRQTPGAPTTSGIALPVRDDQRCATNNGLESRKRESLGRARDADDLGRPHGRRGSSTDSPLTTCTMSPIPSRSTSRSVTTGVGRSDEGGSRPGRCAVWPGTPTGSRSP